MRTLFPTLALLLAALATPARAVDLQTHVDAAIGGPDLEWDLSATDAAACRDACARAPLCCAYTYDGRCRLKVSSPSLLPRKDSISGVRASCAGTQAPVSIAEKLKDPYWRISELQPKSDVWWRTLPLPPFEERATTPGPELIDFVHAINAMQGEPTLPVSVRPTPAYAEDMRAALAGLPDAVKDRVAKKLRAVLYVAELGSTGLTDSAIDERGRSVSGFTFIDVPRTDTKANAWATMKESSPFKPDGEHVLTAEIEDAEDDTRTNAIQYILLHEFGHVLAIGENLHPEWDTPVSTRTRANDYPFFTQSWTVSPKGEITARQDALLAGLPGRLRFYHQAESELPASAMADVYARLSSTTFVTLYGATNPFDDFAEAFASYVHVVLLNRPYRIKIAKAGQVVMEYGSCWEEPRCAAKRKLIESFLAGKPPPKSPSPVKKPK